MALTYPEVMKAVICNMDNKARALRCLRELVVPPVTTYKLVSSVDHVEIKQRKITVDTLNLMLNEEDYPPSKMTKGTFYRLVWLLQIHHAWDHQDYQTSLTESANNFSVAFRRFTDPQYWYEQKLVKNLVGNYQGYRWSIAKPGSLLLFSLSVTYKPEFAALFTEETVVDGNLKTKEVFEGSIAFHHANQNQLYLISRIKKANQLTGIQSTIIHNYDCDHDSGQVNRMKGVVFSRYASPYVSGVVFYRDSKSNLKKNFVVPDKDLDPIVQELNSISVDIAGPQNNV